MSAKQYSDLDFLSASRILNLPAPNDPNEPARLADLNSAVEGLAWKDNCRVATVSNINLLSPGATLDGVAMVSGDRVLVKDQSSAPENGIYIWNGAAVAMTRAPDASTASELEQATTTVNEGSSAGSSFRQTSVSFVLGSGNVAWTSFGVVTPAASEAVAGKIEIATQGETDGGVDDERAVTPAKLANWAGRKLKYSANFGDGSATSYAITHNLGSRDIHVAVYRNSSPWDTVLCDVERTDTNTVTLRFTVAPTSNQFRAVVLG
jgi:hypothetical protein